MLKGLGRRFLKFVKDVWSFLRGEWEDLSHDGWAFIAQDIIKIAEDEIAPAVLKAWSELDPVGAQADAIRQIQDKIRTNPEEALAVLVDLSLIPGPWLPSNVGRLTSAVAGFVLVNAFQD